MEHRHLIAPLFCFRMMDGKPSWIVDPAEGGGRQCRGLPQGGWRQCRHVSGGEGGTAEGGDFRSLRTWASRGALTASSTSSMACKSIARMFFSLYSEKRHSTHGYRRIFNPAGADAAHSDLPDARFWRDRHRRWSGFALEFVVRTGLLS